MIRDARPGDLTQVGDLRVTAYRAGGHLSPHSGYEPTLRGLGAAGDGTVLVAVPAGDDSLILGTAMLQYWPNAGRVVTGPDEAEIRALAVAPDGQGRGTGSALLRAVIERATQRAIRHLVLVTQPDMRAAHHLYEREGFARLPERDWSPVPGAILLAYGLPLTSEGWPAPPDTPIREPYPAEVNDRGALPPEVSHDPGRLDPEVMIRDS
jgi:ribosomal protein S18 acetylase RimI-like enzyme